MQKNMSLLNGIILLKTINTVIVFSRFRYPLWNLESFHSLSFFFLVSAQTLKSNLDSMNQQIQRLEKDIKNFPKTQDEHDKFVEKMSISFLHIFTGNLRFLIIWLSIYST